MPKLSLYATGGPVIKRYIWLRKHFGIFVRFMLRKECQPACVTIRLGGGERRQPREVAEVAGRKAVVFASRPQQAAVGRVL